MHKTRIDLAEKTRRKVTPLLSERLAEPIDLSLQAKQAHWNVTGPSFSTLHALFDSIASVAAGHADEIAERLAALGGTAEGTIAAVSKRSRLPAYPLATVRGTDHLAAMAVVLAAAGGSPASVDRSGGEGRRSGDGGCVQGDQWLARQAALARRSAP
jgi:starvation-inducible DNA-binding protein